MGPPRILLLDDEPFQLKLLAHQLANLGMNRVDCCSSGPEALARLAMPEPAETIIFLDLSMPGMDGVEFIRQLVRIKYSGALVLISGVNERIQDSAERLARARQLNVLGHLSKPVQPEGIRGVLQDWQNTMPKSGGKTQKRYTATEVRHAIARGQLVNYYQPKIHVASGALSGVETLVRWEHPKDGLVYPDQFIGVAEEHGLINDLTNRVLCMALEQASHWLAEGMLLRLAVNVSMDNLARLDFPDFVQNQIDRWGIAPTDLILEVTESRFVKDVLLSLDIFTRLRLKKISLSIDDFGTGNSSLLQLRDMPFDELKIDGSFVHGAATDNTRNAIFTASLGMARQLGITTVAEGVEDQADWDFLRQKGCDLAQGYFIAKAMPAADLRAWASHWKARCAEQA